MSYIFRRTKSRARGWREIGKSRCDVATISRYQSRQNPKACKGKRGESCRNRDVLAFPSTIIRNIWIRSAMTSPMRSLTFITMGRPRIQNISSGRLVEAGRKGRIASPSKAHGTITFYFYHSILKKFFAWNTRNIWLFFSSYFFIISWKE